MIEQKTEGSLRILTLSEPPANALSQASLEQLYHCVKTTRQNRSIRCVLIRSAWRAGFSSGLDLRAIRDAKGALALKLLRAERRMAKTVRLIQHSPQIYVCALSGSVAGAAVSLAMACDLRIADESVWFWMPDVQYGGLLADGAAALVRESAGRSCAAGLCLTCERADGRTLYQMGLIHRLTGPDKLQEETSQLIKRLCRFSPLSIAGTKRLLCRKRRGFPWLDFWKTARHPETRQRLDDLLARRS